MLSGDSIIPTLSVRQLQFLTPDSSVRRLEKPGTYEKDILRVGRWRVGDESWEVTSDTLAEIKRNFDAGQSRKLDCPVVWNHSSDVRDRCGVVQSLSIRGDELFATFSAATPEDEAKILNSGGVSVEVREPFIDGIGNEYPLMLTHLGIVSHPVIPGQGPFKRLSIDSNNKGASRMRYATRQLKLANGNVKAFTRQLADGEDAAPDETVTDAPPAPEPAAPEDYPSLDDAQFNAVKKIVEKLLSRSDGISLPDGVTGENLIANVENMLNTLEQVKPVITEETPADTVDATPVEGMTADAMQMAIKHYRKREADRKASEEKAKQLAMVQAKTSFVTKLDSLCKTTQVLAKSRPDLLSAGEASGWKLSILAPFEESGPQLNTESKTRKLAGSEINPNSTKTVREMALATVGLSKTAK